MTLFVGLMSGTSLDGVDAVLARPQHAGSTSALIDLGFVHQPFGAELRAELLALNTPGPNEIHRAALTANAVARAYAQVVQQLLQKTGVTASAVTALGAHGQTVRHRPLEFDETGYTVQLLNGALLAELSGIDVVCDLRSRDVAAGGQGAPLVPAFHAASFAVPGQDVAVLNLGGIANLSCLRANGAVHGFDCGPGNVLLDLWCQQRRGWAYDAAGAWAATGKVNAAVLNHALAEPFFHRQPPKSTGRDLFDEAWLHTLLSDGRGACEDQDIAATLAELTAQATVNALLQHAETTTELLVCGGGAYNHHLLARLAALLGAQVSVTTTAAHGMAPERVEALAFAWLAQAFVERRAGNLSSVTGARGQRVLGALHPAGWSS